MWRAYTVAQGDQLEVVLDRVRLIRGVHITPTEHRCPLCQLSLRRIDGTDLFCTAGCDARTIPPRADGTGDFLPARRLPEDGIVERRFEVRGRFDPDPVGPIAECLRDARRVAKEHNTEERANNAHLSEMWELARGLQPPSARAGMAGAFWVALEFDAPSPGGSAASARVTVRRAATGHRNGIEVESWPLYATRSTWERIPGAAERRRDIAVIDEAARRVDALAKGDSETQRPRYARLRSSLASSSDAGPSSTISPVEST